MQLTKKTFATSKVLMTIALLTTVERLRTRPCKIGSMTLRFWKMTSFWQQSALIKKQSWSDSSFEAKTYTTLTSGLTRISKNTFSAMLLLKVIKAQLGCKINRTIVLVQRLTI